MPKTDRPLLSKAVIQAPAISVWREAAFGQKQTFGSKENPAEAGLQL
jgi:hypothetical protein